MMQGFPPKAGHFSIFSKRGFISSKLGFINLKAVFKNLKKLRFLVWYALLSLLYACGLEDYPFLDPVPQGNITLDTNVRASITLPDVSDSSQYGPRFTIYYRIYISGIPPSGQINEGEMSGLNPTLYADYGYFYPYTNRDTAVSTAVGTLFNNRNYKTLVLEGADIERNVLSQSAGGKRIVLDFPQVISTIPTLGIDGVSYNLWRSNGSGLFRPKPEDRYFRNHQDLRDSANVTRDINADVASGSGLYTYVSLYIVVAGIDNKFSPLYSAPTFIGVLCLPEA